MHRRFRYASRNMGSLSTVSALALIGGGSALAAVSASRCKSLVPGAQGAGVEALDVLLEFADHEEAAVESGVPGDFDGVCVVKSVLEYKSGSRPPPDR